ncbi:MAG: hypothetical protein LBV00_03500 [Propionibacteriaceae bacterium]|jgi:cellobiose phosphorylase|nr:hypothetical protein [Propionibacteriaceae bacterium]
MQYGHYDDAAREYVITTPNTPLPWINYLGNQDFFSLLSNRGGGYCFYRDAKLRRLTRFRYQSIPADNDGRFLFINDAGDVWSPTFAPVQAPLDSYECRHGLGYSRVSGARGGIQCDVTYFVPLDASCEVQRVHVRNLSDGRKTLKLFSYVEWCLWDGLDDMLNLQRNLSIGEVEIDGSTIYHVTEYRERRNHDGFYSVNTPIEGYDTDRDCFIGGPWESLSTAAVPAFGVPTNSLASGWYPIASHCVAIDLEPGESRDLVFVLGYAENPEDDKWEPLGDVARSAPVNERVTQRRPPAGRGLGADDRADSSGGSSSGAVDQRGQSMVAGAVAPAAINKAGARALLARFSTTEQVDAELARLATYWDELLGQFRLESADDKMNRSVNIWNQYQCMVTFNLSRSASYFETGIGRGMGFRDSNQDLLGVVAMVPQRARQRILDLAGTQFPDGSAYHQYQPLTKRGNHDLGSGFNDDPLWLIWGVAAYIKETGDFSILDENVPFDNDESLARRLIDHLVASWRHVADNLGPHGLPLIGRADWNDCLNLNAFTTTPGESFQTTTNREGGVAESVFIGGMAVATCPDLADLLERRGEEELAGQVRDFVASMHQALREHGWDGAWFRRAYDAYGSPVGSISNDEGQIYIEPQGMCIMGGSGVDDGRAATALESVNQRLASQHGVSLVAPPYTRYHVELGEISSYPPGYKENGGIFCHNNPWIIIAETMAGTADRAFDYYRRITPAYREDISDVHLTEPYVYSQMIAGPAAPRFGQAKNSWLTGTAAWTWHAATCWLLGVRPSLDGLVVDPKMPVGFGEYTVTRRFRGATYIIHIVGSGASGGPATPATLSAPGTDSASATNSQSGSSPATSGTSNTPTALATSVTPATPISTLTVDGVPITGDTIPVAPAGTTVEVEWVARS